MSLLLNVPFSEKNKAKSLGAKWDPQLKKWYIENQKEYHKLRRWFKNENTNLIVSDNLYIIVGNQTCFKCKKNTKVISLAASNYVTVYIEDDVEDETSELFNGEINFITDIDDFPSGLKKYLNETFKYYKGYSKTINGYYFGNHCNNCGTLQGDFFLYDEPDSPFWLDSNEKIKDLLIYKIKLENDLELNCSVGWGSSDSLIPKLATFKELELKL